MRESINYNMIPLPCDNMNILVNVGSRNFLTNISSNAYYGYQPQAHVQKKETPLTDSTQATKDTLSMEVQDVFHENSCDMQIENELRQSSRKRPCCYDEFSEFKKRRQNHEYVSSINVELQKLDTNKGDEERKEMEDILRETHGVNMYHWLRNED